MVAPEVFERDLAERLHAVDRLDVPNPDLSRVLARGRRGLLHRRVWSGVATTGIAASALVAGALGGQLDWSADEYPAVPPAPTAGPSTSTVADRPVTCMDMQPAGGGVWICQLDSHSVPFPVDDRRRPLPRVATRELPSEMWLYEMRGTPDGRRFLVAAAPGDSKQQRFDGLPRGSRVVGYWRAGTAPWVGVAEVPSTSSGVGVDLLWRDSTGDLFSARDGRARSLGFGAGPAMVRFEIVPDRRAFEVTGRSGFQYRAVLWDTPRVVSGEVSSSDPFVMLVIPGKATRVVMPADAKVEASNVSTASLSDVDVTVAYLSLASRSGSTEAPGSASWTDAAGKRWTINFSDEWVTPAE